MLQALSEHALAPGIVAGTSVGSLNGAVVALDPASAANRLSHLWARLTREQVFPGGLPAQARTLQHARTHLFPSTSLASVIGDFLGPGATFADLALLFYTALVTMRAQPAFEAPLVAANVPVVYLHGPRAAPDLAAGLPADRHAHRDRLRGGLVVPARPGHHRPRPLRLARPGPCHMATRHRVSRP